MLPGDMRLHPNPPRLITVGAAVALMVVGAILALPVTPALELLDPLRDLIRPYGVDLDAQLGWLLLFAGDVLLIAGSLLPGI
jgi:hypothetical protein